MTWNELKKKAIEKGFEKLRHGSEHDIYINRETKRIIQIERHWTKEVGKGLLIKLKKEIGF